MKAMTFIRSPLVTLLLMAVVNWAEFALAQVEMLNPNPTMPADIGHELDYRGISAGGAGLGRISAREANPAETLLRSINGTNYGRATGHALFSRSAVERALRYEGRRVQVGDRATEHQRTNVTNPLKPLHRRRAAAGRARPAAQRGMQRAIGLPRTPTSLGSPARRRDEKRAISPDNLNASPLMLRIWF